VLSERPTLIQIAGAVVVCTGVLAASLTAPSPRPGRARRADDDAVRDDRARAARASLASAP